MSQSKHCSCINKLFKIKPNKLIQNNLIEGQYKKLKRIISNSQEIGKSNKTECNKQLKEAYMILMNPPDKKQMTQHSCKVYNILRISIEILKNQEYLRKLNNNENTLTSPDNSSSETDEDNKGRKNARKNIKTEAGEQSQPTQLSFKQEIDKITAHYYKPQGTYLKVHWKGFNLYTVEKIGDIIHHKQEIKSYIENLSTRAKNTLIKRQPSVLEIIKST